MTADSINKILGDSIPNALKSVHELEKRVAPLLAKAQAHKADIDKVDPELTSMLDKAMKDVREAKEKLRNI